MGFSRCGMHAGSRGPRCCDACDRCPRCDGITLKTLPCPAGYCGADHLCARCRTTYADKLKLAHAACAAAKAASDKRFQTINGVVSLRPVPLP